MPTTRFVLTYLPNAAAMAKAKDFFPQHISHFHKYHAEGKLLTFGAFADLVQDGSMGIFTTRESAEEFVKEDPFVIEGIVSIYRIREWNLSVE